MKYYSAIKKDQVLIYATMWMNLENMPSERSQTEKATYCMIPFIYNLNPEQAKSQRQKTDE